MASVKRKNGTVRLRERIRAGLENRLAAQAAGPSAAPGCGAMTAAGLNSIAADLTKIPGALRIPQGLSLAGQWRWLDPMVWTTTGIWLRVLGMVNAIFDTGTKPEDLSKPLAQSQALEAGHRDAETLVLRLEAGRGAVDAAHNDLHKNATGGVARFYATLDPAGQEQLLRDLGEVLAEEAKHKAETHKHLKKTIKSKKQMAAAVKESSKETSLLQVLTDLKADRSVGGATLREAWNFYQEQLAAAAAEPAPAVHAQPGKQKSRKQPR